jgi:hypothetical protein
MRVHVLDVARGNARLRECECMARRAPSPSSGLAVRWWASALVP